jgi:hypothetical protein
MTILEGTLIPVASLCMVISLTLFLGGLFHKIQPWFSLIQGILAFLFGLYCFWFAYKISKSASKSHTKVWNNYNFRFSVKAGTISLITVIPTFFVATMKRPTPIWVSLTVFSIGFGLFLCGEYRLGLFRAFRELGEIKEGFHQEKLLSTDAHDLGQIAAFISVGLLYIIIFLPFMLWYTTTRSQDFINVLLFARFAEASIGLDALGRLTTMLNFSNPSHLLAFAVFYGAANITFALMRICLRKEGWLEILVVSNGLFGGYMLTILVKHLLGSPLTSRLLFSSTLSLGYVFLLYYGLRSLLDVISRWGIRKKYEDLIQGIQSIGTAYILSRVFGDQSVVFSGVVFYISAFMATTVFEVTIGRLVKMLYKFIPDKHGKSTLSLIIKITPEDRTQFRTSLRATAVISGVSPLLALGIFKLAIMAL